jgi:hypothetical protein
LTVRGPRREWREAPYPEKLWLVRKIRDRSTNAPTRSAAVEIGVARVTTQFRAEIAELVLNLERE